MEQLTPYQTSRAAAATLPERISLHLTNEEWRQLTALILDESHTALNIADKYMRALLFPLLKQVYIKLHNKLHSLKISNNTLTLTLPEASVLNTTLVELNSQAYLVVQIIAYIDQKLT